MEIPPEILDQNVVEAHELSKADIILVDMEKPKTDLLLEFSNDIKDNLVILLNFTHGIYRYPRLIRKFIERGFVRSWAPIDSGDVLLIRRSFTDNFLKKTINVYRESFIHGPNPVHYNTAYMLYILGKFVLKHREGVIVEVGTGRGFSTLWLTHVAMEYGSKVISLDSRCDRIEYTRNIMEDLGLTAYAELLCRDARNNTYEGYNIIYAFIDGKKDEYHLYLKSIEPYLDNRALVVAHNTLSSTHEMIPYIERVYGVEYESLTIQSDPAGITLSIYKPRE